MEDGESEAAAAEDPRPSTASAADGGARRQSQGVAARVVVASKRGEVASESSGSSPPPEGSCWFWFEGGGERARVSRELSFRQVRFDRGAAAIRRTCCRALLPRFLGVVRVVVAISYCALSCGVCGTAKSSRGPDGGRRRRHARAPNFCAAGAPTTPNRHHSFRPPTNRQVYGVIVPLGPAGLVSGRVDRRGQAGLQERGNRMASRQARECARAPARGGGRAVPS